MATDIEILREAKTRQAAGDSRALSVIAIEVKAELAELAVVLAPPAPVAGQVVGEITEMKNGVPKVVQTFVADGSGGIAGE